MRSCVVALSISAAAASGAIPATFVGMLHDSGNAQNCSLVQLDPNTGSNVTLSRVNACVNTTETWPSSSALNTDTGLLEVVIASAPYIFAFDVTTGEQTEIAALPPYNNSDPFLGLVHVGGASYLVTQYNLWQVADGALQHVGGVNLPDLASVAAAPLGGTNGAPIIFVADEGSSTVHAIDLGLSPPPVTTFVSGVKGPWDMQYQNSTGLLLMVADYELYSVDPASVSDLLQRTGQSPGLSLRSSDSTRILWFQAVSSGSAI